MIAELSLIIAEMKGRDVLLSNSTRICGLLNCRSDIRSPYLNATRVEPSSHCIEAAVISSPSPCAVLIGTRSSPNITALLEMGATTVAAGAVFVAVEQPIGSEERHLSASELLLFFSGAASAIVNEYDLIADDAVMKLLLPVLHSPSGRCLLVGDLSNRLRTFVDEIQLGWNDPEESPLFKPEFTFRLAAALTAVPELDPGLDTYENVAYELQKHNWFPYNVEDTRKAVGALANVWGLSKKDLHMLPHEARKRGFPDLCHADRLFTLIQNLDHAGEYHTSASGDRFDILHLSSL